MAEVHQHDRLLRDYVRRSFPGVRDVEDVVQESYLRVWRRQMISPITEVTGAVKASVKGFLFQVARRLALDTIRHNRASPVDASVDPALLSPPGDNVDVAESACSNQEFELLFEAIDRLPARCREVVILRKLHGLPPSVIAKHLGISEETVFVQARRGLEKIRDYLNARGAFPDREP